MQLTDGIARAPTLGKNNEVFLVKGCGDCLVISDFRGVFQRSGQGLGDVETGILVVGLRLTGR